MKENDKSEEFFFQNRDLDLKSLGERLQYAIFSKSRAEKLNKMAFFTKV